MKKKSPRIIFVQRQILAAAEENQAKPDYGLNRNLRFCMKKAGRKKILDFINYKLVKSFVH